MPSVEPSNESSERLNLVVCGIGGSGTRALVQLLQDIDPRYQLRDRTFADDSRAATLLLKQRLALGEGPLCFEKGWRILQRVLEGRGVGEFQDYVRLIRLSLISRPIHSRFWCMKRAIRLVQEAGAGRGSAWIVKEPNLHMFAEQILESRDDLVVVVVVRDGLDMAFSGNQQQVLTWSTDALTPAASLEFWCRSHSSLLEVQGRHPRRLLFVHFEELCHQPAKGVLPFRRIFSAEQMEELAEGATRVFKAPPSIGRHLEEDLSVIPEALQDRARQIRARLMAQVSLDS